MFKPSWPRDNGKGKANEMEEMCASTHLKIADDDDQEVKIEID